jgi:hypothetical protein
MKKLILLLALTLAFVMCGCVSKNQDGSIKLNTGNANNPQVIIIDSCEYIHWTYGLAHKGNCKYCVERRKKEQEELIRKINSL